MLSLKYCYIADGFVLLPHSRSISIGHKVIDVACGSGDAQTLCITEGGQVWSWGDGDYGKLGRGGSDGCKTPLSVDKLEGHCICRVECGSQFSVALSTDGTLFTW